ncbi:MAG: hypothetical protein ACJ8C4_18375 [Gemmataceae bacterium]
MAYVQRAPLMPQVGLCVQHRQMHEAVIAGPAIAHQPAGEHLYRPQVVVAAGNATTCDPQVGKCFLDPTRVDVENALELAGGDDRFRPLFGQLHVVRRRSLVGEV